MTRSTTLIFLYRHATYDRDGLNADCARCLLRCGGRCAANVVGHRRNNSPSPEPGPILTDRVSGLRDTNVLTYVIHALPEGCVECENLYRSLRLIATVGHPTDVSSPKPAMSPSDRPPSKPKAAVNAGLEPLACTACRSRKLKCDRSSPTCSRCTKAGTECVYPESRRKPAFKRRNVRELEERLGMAPQAHDVTA